MKYTRLILFAALALCISVASLNAKKKAKTEDDAANFGLPPYTGVKHALGVSSFNNEAGYVSEWTIGDNMAYMLESALFETKRFVIVERQDLGAVLAEQDLQNSGRSAASSQVAQTGQVRSAKYLATGAITEVSYDVKGGGGGLNIKGFRIGGSSKKAEIVAVIKIVDTSTGIVVASERVRGSAGSSSLSLGYTDWSGIGGNIGGFVKTPLGQAAQDVINHAVRFISLEMEDYDIEGSVVMVSGKGQVVVNRGENYGLSKGQVFTVNEEGETLIDPSTGEVLDEMEGEEICTIRVVKVKEKVCYCEIISGEKPERGAVVIF